MVLRLKVAIERRPHTEALLDGRVAPPSGVEVDFVEVRPINQAFRRMLREEEFDVSEMAVGTHYLAKARGARLSALPVFLARHYPHHLMQLRAGLASPRELAGGRIGSRSYTMTTALWARGALARQAGLDLDGVTWVVADEEHIVDTVLPDNVSVVPGADLKAMLSAGDLDGGIALHAEGRGVGPLWSDVEAAERDWWERTHARPVNHTLVVRDDLLAGSTGLAEELFGWFVEGARVGLPDGADAEVAGGYGLTEGNRTALEELLELTRAQVPGEDVPDDIEDCFLDIAS
jgi:4,5-dihydroxyphthalate decarboxylase